MIHSPFEVRENFISPLQCERIVSALALTHPNIAENGQPLKYERHVPTEVGGSVMSELNAIVPLVEQRYSATLAADPSILFQQFWENQKAPAEAHWAEGWRYSRKKWMKSKDVDLVGFIWLKDFHTSVPLDPRYEVFGGKLEFPAYNFSLTPVRGTLVLYPATPHFVAAISHVMLGTLEQIKVTMTFSKANGAWSYQPSNFPGSYQDWFIPEE